MKAFIMQDSSIVQKNIWLTFEVCYSHRQSLSYLLSNFSLLITLHRLRSQWLFFQKKIPTDLGWSNFICWSQNSVRCMSISHTIQMCITETSTSFLPFHHNVFLDRIYLPLQRIKHQFFVAAYTSVNKLPCKA